MLWTSHNMAEVEEITDRIIFIESGKIIAEGTAAEVVKSFGASNLEEVFLQVARKGPPGTGETGDGGEAGR